MEKKAALELIEKTFNTRFNVEQYTLFMRNLLNDYDEEKERDWVQENSIYESFREHINRFKHLGIYTDPEGYEVELLVIETKSTAKLEKARTSLRNFVIKRLNDKNRDYALAAFYSKEDNGADWRFSFIKIEHESYKDDKGKVKTKKELTPAKRFSYLVGEHEHTYTVQKQLLPVLQNDNSNPGLEDLESCFSIEKVTDEFFEQYKELYLKLSEHFSSDKGVKKILVASGIDSTRFAKKLLGQIVFLYFLQKKGWLGVPKNEPWGKGDKRFVQSLFEKAEKQKQNFFKDHLQFLFYEALAKVHSNSPDPAYYKRFDCKIPFLNGGLFEADYEWQTANLSIPNNLFRNEEKNKAGDKGTGILDVFDRYNFTIKEDEPLEKEVAVDPEMLGKVFENMLEITERKSKGAFYTPREVVHYMCQESLINYLDNSINDAAETLVPLPDIETFVRKGFLATENDQIIIEKGKETSSYKFQLPEAVRTNADELDRHLTSIKICDPAIGSGAFPVGLLHELVTAQRVLLPYLSDKYLEKKLKEIGLSKADFKKDTTKYIYRVKRHAIQESIYGVDIDASAIDIARLRLWLSLIVDEEDFYSIETLPNLDYKIVHGSSLIGLPDNAMKDLATEAELEQLKDNFFNETNETQKKRSRAKINTTIRKLLDSAEQFAGYKIDFDFKLCFSEVWHYKKGFDIVIGNPPYVNIYTIEDDQKKIFKHLYTTAHKKFDLYVLFFEKGIKLLNQKGQLSLITSNKYFSQPYGFKLRELILKKRILQIVNFRFNIFSATVDTAITSINNLPPVNSFKVFDIVDKNKYKDFINRLPGKDFERNSILQNNEVAFRIEITDHDKGILAQFEDSKLVFSDICYVNYGCRLVSKDGTKKKSFYIHENNPGRKYKEFIEGSDIRKFQIKSSRFLNYSPKEHYLALFSELFDVQKLVSKDVVGKDGLSIAYDSHGYYNDHTVINAVKWDLLKKVSYSGIRSEITDKKIEQSAGYSYEELLCMINSEVANYYFNKLYNIDLHFYPGIFQKMLVHKKPSKELTIIGSYIIQLTSMPESDLAIAYFKTLSNGVIYELFFPAQIKASDKGIIEHLSRLKPIDAGMKAEQKLSIIQSEFTRLHAPDHPVRKNLETLDSVKEVRIIKETLK